MQNATFWLSETPEEPSLSWDAALKRTVTWAKFQNIKSGKTFYFFNTHFDHKGEIARLESAILLKRKIEQIIKGHTFVLTGDFNCEPTDDPYKHLTNKTDKESVELFDTGLISKTGHYGSTGTFTGFNLNPEISPEIDYIFVGENISVRKHATLSDSFDGRLPSDHYPILVELALD